MFFERFLAMVSSIPFIGLCLFNLSCVLQDPDVDILSRRRVSTHFQSKLDKLVRADLDLVVVITEEGVTCSNGRSFVALNKHMGRRQSMQENSSPIEGVARPCLSLVAEDNVVQIRLEHDRTWLHTLFHDDSVHFDYIFGRKKPHIEGLLSTNGDYPSTVDLAHRSTMKLPHVGEKFFVLNPPVNREDVALSPHELDGTLATLFSFSQAQAHSHSACWRTVFSKSPSTIQHSDLRLARREFKSLRWLSYLVIFILL